MPSNFLIIGDDTYIRKREEIKLRDKFLSSDEIELNFSVFNGDNVSEMMDSINTLPFIADKRVVLLKDVQKVQDNLFETLLNYLEQPLASSTLIISFDSSFKKNKFYKKIQKHVQEIVADSPGAFTLRKWIKGFFAKENIEINEDAINLLIELKGDDTVGVKIELEKLALFSGGDRIEYAHVEELVGRNVRETVFKLVDAINKNDAKWLYQILEDLYAQKKQPPEIIGYMGWYVKVIQKIMLLAGKGQNVNEIASGIKYSVAYTRRLFAQSKQFSKERIAFWAKALLDADREIKTGLKKPNLAIETMFARMLKK